MSQLNEWLDKKDQYHKPALKCSKLIEEEESLLGTSVHLLGVGRRP